MLPRLHETQESRNHTNELRSDLFKTFSVTCDASHRKLDARPSGNIIETRGEPQSTDGSGMISAFVASMSSTTVDVVSS